jgi:hypothetical protein
MNDTGLPVPCRVFHAYSTRCLHFYKYLFAITFNSQHVIIAIDTTWRTQWHDGGHITNINQDNDDLATTKHQEQEETDKSHRRHWKWGPKHVVWCILGRWVCFFSYITNLTNILFVYRYILLPVTTQDAWRSPISHGLEMEGVWALGMYFLQFSCVY